MNPDNKACIAELRISVETRCRPDLDDIDSANILSVIEQLQSRIAELEAENARLKKVTHVSLPTNTMEQWVASEIRRATSHIKEQLAASQLREIQLREALESCFEKMRQMCLNGEWYDPDKAIDLAWNALSQPTSTEALDAYVAEKVKELSDEHRRATLIRYEQTAEIIRQRDLAVEALEWIASSLPQIGVERVWMLDHAIKTLLAAIKESEVKE